MAIFNSYVSLPEGNWSSWPGDWQLLGARGILDSWPLGHHSLRRWVRRGNGGCTAQLQPWLLAAVLRHLEVHDHDRLKEMCGHDERTVSRETWSIYLMFLYLNGQNLGGVPPRIHGSSLPSNCGIPWGWLGASSRHRQAQHRKAVQAMWRESPGRWLSCAQEPIGNKSTLVNAWNTILWYILEDEHPEKKQLFCFELQGTWV